MTDDPDCELARLALDLGYADQAHLTRDFGSTVGLPPAAYARACRAAGAEPGSVLEPVGGAA